MMRDARIEFRDKGPDALGRRLFFLLWNDLSGEYRLQPSPSDGRPVGHRRAQVFFAVPPIDVLEGT